jgi:SPP1 gp7 family putative phage head morphogenesis protein
MSTQIATKEIQLFNHLGVPMQTKALDVPDLDPTFFYQSNNYGNLSSKEIEKKPYQLHWAVHSCARAIMTNLCRLPHGIYGEDEKKIPKHPVWQLLKRPNPFMTWRTFWEAIILYYLLPCREGFGRSLKGGQVFLVMDSGKEDPKCNVSRGDIPATIYPYTDEFIAAEFNNNKKFLGWKLEIPGPEPLIIHYAPNEILRVYAFNPYNWLEGLSRYAPAQMAIINDIKADIWNNRTFENDAVPAGVLSSDQELTNQQADEIKNRWYQQYAGVGNARRVAILGKGAEFQKIANTPKDMEFMEQKGSVEDQLLAVFGLNKIGIGKYEDVNYATLVEGHKMLWEDTYLPIEEAILEQINSNWINNIDVRNEIHLKADTSGIRILKKDYSVAVKSAQIMYTMGVPADISFRITEVPLTEEDLSVAPWLKEKPVPVATVGGNPNAPGNSTEPPTPKGTQKSFIVIKGGFNSELLTKISNEYIERVLNPGENTFHSKLVRMFNDERNYCQDLVDAWIKSITKAKKTPSLNPEDFLFDQSEEDQKLLKIYKNQVESQLYLEASKLKEELGAFVNWGVSDVMINEYVEARREGLAGINSTTMQVYGDKIEDAIKDGYAHSFTPQQYAKAIKEAISDSGEIRKHQARTIARTETGIISSDARFDCFKNEGIEEHQWLTAEDDKVRETHEAENGNIVKVGEPFPETGLLHPLDPDGEPEEIINCRCTTIAVQERD